MKTKFLILAIAIGAIAGAIYSWNYVALGRPMAKVLSQDTRNSGIIFKVHYENWVNPSIVVIDLRNISSTNSPADVFRVLLQYAAAKKAEDYSYVKLAHRGSVKFLLKGEYFKTIGVEYDQQNPVYTMRTFSENLFTPNGKAAYGTWTGGWLGVLKQQMDDFNDFHKKWYIDDIASGG